MDSKEPSIDTYSDYKLAVCKGILISQVNKNARHLLIVFIVFLLSSFNAYSESLNENCTVSVLNRTTQVKPDGSWFIPDIPSGFGLVRVRASCVEDGLTTSGQSELFEVTTEGLNGMTPFGTSDPTPIPVSITLAAPASVLTATGSTVQIAVIARYDDNSTQDITPQSAGTSYVTTNPSIAIVDLDGLATAVSSGTVLISAINDGAVGLIQIRVQLSGDTDSDGIPDDLEIANGLDPNNNVDALEDPDGDGLNNKQELVDYGTNRNLADTDSDGILDGEEVVAGVLAQREMDFPGFDLSYFRTGALPQTPRFSEASQET